MKRCITFFAILLFSISVIGQTTIAKWSFPTGTSTDANPDGGISQNSSKTITAVGTSSIDFSKNGLTTKAAQATGWDNGNGTKYWQIEVETTGYGLLTLSSKMQAGGTYYGPKDFKAQYRIGTDGTWTDIPNTTIVTANDWLTGVLTNVALPADCENKTSLFIRWIMTSNSGIDNNSVGSAGVLKIDDILISGSTFNSVDIRDLDKNVRIYPNPSKGNQVIVINSEIIDQITISDLSGKVIQNFASNKNSVSISTSSMAKGLYIIAIQSKNKKIVKKLVIN